MEGLWAKCEECDEIIYRQELEKNLNVCPLCGHHMPWPARARLAGAARRRAPSRSSTRELEPHGPARASPTRRSTSDRLRVHPQGAGRERRLHLRRGPHRGPPGVASAASSSSSWAARWARWWARRSPASSSAPPSSKCPAIVFSRLGRRAHAGGHLLADADGEDLRGDRPLPRGEEAVHLGDAAPDHRRRGGVVRLAGRRHPRRAQGAHRLRRPARDRADHPPEAPRGLPALASSCSSTG